MEILFITLLTVSWAAGNMFVSSDGYARKLGWVLPQKTWPISFSAWLTYPNFLIDRLLFRSSKKHFESSYEFAEWSLFYLAWVAQIATPFLVLLIAPWYYIFIVPVIGFLLSFLLFALLKQYIKSVSAFILIFIYMPLVIVLLN